MHTGAATWELPGCSSRFSNCMGAHVAALLQRQFLKLHTSALQSPALALWQDTKLHAHVGCCPAAVAGYQTACTCRLLPCSSGRISNCMRAWLPCCSGRFSNCFIELRTSKHATTAAATAATTTTTTTTTTKQT
jgi:hypothetical protein